ncbi:MAG: helix-turn-helix domain-containing protein [Actinomycetota bacterium]|nr:helix-turn-helix domain-containing protein [Actinomycetota bacterium]
MEAPAAAKYLGIHLLKLYAIIDSGDLPAYKFGRVIHLQRIDVVAYLARCKVQPGTLGHLYPPASTATRPGNASGLA